MYALTFALICTGKYIRSATKAACKVYDYIIAMIRAKRGKSKMIGGFGFTMKK